MGDEDLQLEILSMPATVLNEGNGGWRVFVPAAGAKMQIGWISPETAGVCYVSVSVLPQYAQLGLGIAPCDFVQEFKSFVDAVAGTRPFLLAHRKSIT